VSPNVALGHGEATIYFYLHSESQMHQKIIISVVAYPKQQKAISSSSSSGV
jgi:hypothetical protein